MIADGSRFVVDELDDSELVQLRSSIINIVLGILYIVPDGMAWLPFMYMYMRGHVKRYLI